MTTHDPDAGLGRRRFVQAGTLAAGCTLVPGVGSGLPTATAEGSVTVDDQRSTGESVVITSVRTTVDAELHVFSARKDESGQNILYAHEPVAAGTEATDLTVTLDRQSLQRTRMVRVLLLASVDGEDRRLAGDTAVVAVGEDPDRYGVTLVEADGSSGFEYPYLRYLPPTVGEGEIPLLVQSNNTGTTDDDFAVHLEAAREDVERGTPRRLADALGVPLLMPVFPRPLSDPVDGSHYVHQLDRDTLALEDGPLERVDLQLLAMVDHATAALGAAGLSIRERFMLNGFSASGNFADRFTVLHPERVLSVTAGGLNGMALLPLTEAKGERLDYHVGIADVPELTDESVDLDALDQVDQFLYMGSQDENDTIPYDDAWTSDELRETALTVYGEDMIADRFPFCQTAYERAGVSAQFSIVEGIGHRPVPVERLAEFHRRSMAGEDVSDFGEDLESAARAVGEPSAAFVMEAEAPTVGEAVTFDAGRSHGGDAELVAYTWSFGDDGSAAGDSVTHRFATAGSHQVQLTVVNGDGDTSSTTRTVSVVGSSPRGTTAANEQSTPRTTDTSASSERSASPTTASGPGLGVVAGILGLGAGGTLAHRLRERGRD